MPNCFICSRKTNKMKNNGNGKWLSCKECSDDYDFVKDIMTITKPEIITRIISFMYDIRMKYTIIHKRVRINDEPREDLNRSQIRRRYCNFCRKRLRNTFAIINGNELCRVCSDCEYIFKRFIDMEKRTSRRRLRRLVDMVVVDPTLREYKKQFCIINNLR